MCKIVTGNFFTAAGDLLAQLGIGGAAAGHGGPAEEQEAKAAATPAAGRPVDWARTARLCAETSAFGTPAAHYWWVPWLALLRA